MRRPDHYALEDPATADLARFLTNTPLSNGGFAPIPGAFAGLLAQAVLNYSVNRAWDAQRRAWVPVKEYQALPGGHEVAYEELAPGVHKLTHPETGAYVIDTSLDAAWEEMRRKVADARGSD